MSFLCTIFSAYNIFVEQCSLVLGSAAVTLRFLDRVVLGAVSFDLDHRHKVTAFCILYCFGSSSVALGKSLSGYLFAGG